MRIRRAVTVHYEVNISRDDVIELLQEHDPDFRGLGDVSCAHLRTMLIDAANEDDSISWTLDDLAYETDSGTGRWKA